MESRSIFSRAQAVLAFFGSFMLVLAAVGSMSPDSNPQDGPAPSRSAGLQVRPASGTPGATVNHLQGAGGLQRQEGQGLQRPIGDQLQPNAKTSNLNATKTVQ